MKYKHDCDGCVFLGTHEYDAPLKVGSVRMSVDLYYCVQAESFMGGTIISRYGDEGSNYASCPVSLIRRDFLQRSIAEMSTACPALIEGYHRAVQRSLLKE